MTLLQGIREPDVRTIPWKKEIPVNQILTGVLESNRRYAANFGDKAKLALPPARSFAILTCTDARLDPAKYAGLAEGDAPVIRNAGGRAIGMDSMT